jgi:hypothetical protein
VLPRHHPLLHCDAVSADVCARAPYACLHVFLLLQVIQRIAAGLPEPQPAAAVFVGGLPTAEDEKRLRRCARLHVFVLQPCKRVVLEFVAVARGSWLYCR